MGLRRILLVDDNLADAALAAYVLTREIPELQVIQASSRDALEEALDSPSFDLVITECRLSWADGFRVLQSIRRVTPDCPVLMFTSSGSEDAACEALKQGFADYVPKSPRGYLRLPRLVQGCVESTAQQAFGSRVIAQYQELLEMLDEGAFLASRQGLLLEVNSAFAAMVGFPSCRALRGRSLSDLFPGDALPRFLAGLSPAGVQHSLDLQIRREGRQMSLCLTARCLDQGKGFSAMLVGTVRERREHETAESSLSESESVRPLEPAELQHVVSHDFQEPLHTISRYSRLMLERLADSEPDITRYVRYVVEGADRMRTMLDDYSEYLKIGAGVSKTEEVDLELVLDKVTAGLRATIEETQAKINRAKLPIVRAGFNDLVRLFQNVLTNALKFRGTEAPVIEIAAHRMPAAWLLAVKDNGIGIDPAHFQRIFGMYQRLHTAQELPGTGMGLAICKRIVERYGGRIWVDSQLGAGSTFYFTLPPASARATEPDQQL